MKKRREKTAKNVKKHALLVKKNWFHMTKKRSRVKKSEEEKKSPIFTFSTESLPYIESDQKTETAHASFKISSTCWSVVSDV